MQYGLERTPKEVFGFLQAERKAPWLAGSQADTSISTGPNISS